MNDLDLDRRITGWLEEVAAPRVPPYVDDVLARTRATPQQRALWYRGPMKLLTSDARLAHGDGARWLLLLAALLLAIAGALTVGARLFQERSFELTPPLRVDASPLLPTLEPTDRAPSDVGPLTWSAGEVVDARPSDAPRGCIELPDDPDPGACYVADPGIVGLATSADLAVAVGHEGGEYAEAGYPVVWRSVDGRAWRIVRLEVAEETTRLLGVHVARDGAFVITARSPGGATELLQWRSMDGQGWEPAAPIPFEGEESTVNVQVARGADSYLMLLDGGWSGESVVWRSADGLVWSPAPTPRAPDGLSLRVVAVAGSRAGYVLTVCNHDRAQCRTAASTDGEAWTTSEPLGRDVRVTWHEGRWLIAAVGDSDAGIALLESQDATVWSAVRMPDTTLGRTLGGIASARDRVFLWTDTFSQTHVTSDLEKWETVDLGSGPPAGVAEFGNGVLVWKYSRGSIVWFGVPEQGG